MTYRRSIAGWRGLDNGQQIDTEEEEDGDDDEDDGRFEGGRPFQSGHDHESAVMVFAKWEENDYALIEMEARNLAQPFLSLQA